MALCKASSHKELKYVIGSDHFKNPMSLPNHTHIVVARGRTQSWYAALRLL